MKSSTISNLDSPSKEPFELIGYQVLVQEVKNNLCGQPTPSNDMLEFNLCPNQWRAIKAILYERDRQDAKWGIQNHTLSYWVGILGEEYGEFCQAVNETVFDNGEKERAKGGADNLIAELTQVAAVAVGAIECIMRNGLDREYARTSALDELKMLKRQCNSVASKTAKIADAKEELSEAIFLARQFTEFMKQARDLPDTEDKELDPWPDYE